MPTDFASLMKAAKASGDDSEATTLLAELRSAGFTVEEDAGKLWVKPTAKLTADHKKRVTQHKDAILSLLASEKPKEPTAEWVTLKRGTFAIFYRTKRERLALIEDLRKLSW